MKFGGALRSVSGMLGMREETGAAAVEFAICASCFVIIVAGTVDFGYWIYAASALTAAVSAGSQYAENNAALVLSNPTALQSDVQTIVENAVGTSWASATVNVNNGGDTTGCYCPTGSPGTWSWGSVVKCGNTCANGGVAGQFVTITASHTVSPLFPTYKLTYNGTINRGALVETQ